jgi:16S rRNA (guanine966-N2)-methyltransferase
MTRIIAGVAGGRRLTVPPKGTRPTSDRVREALFSTVESELLARGEAWTHLHVLDLYAGSGALGLEALSRGAASVVLVEKAPSAAAVLRANVEAVGLSGATVMARDVGHLVGDPVAATLVLVDPPYDVPAEQVGAVLSHVKGQGWIADEALVVVERSGRDGENPFPDTWVMERRRAYGDTVLWYGRAVG